MPDHTFLAHLVLTYAIALVLVVGLARVRVPAIVAMMLAGVVAGPSGLRVIGTAEEVETLAELGIVLLLFTVGLDFSLAAVKQIWRTIVIAGTLQIIVTAMVVAGLAMLVVGAPLQLAIFIGLFVALSSTAIVLKGLAERNELSAPHGRLTVGILLLQDLAIVVLLLLVPILSGQTPVSAVPRALACALLAIAAVAAVSRLVLPRLLRLVTASGRREAFPLAILVASVGTAWLGSLMGLSMAVGAFLAGLMLAESEFSHQAYAEVRPIRDMLVGTLLHFAGHADRSRRAGRAPPRRRGRHGGDHRAEGRDRDRCAARGVVAHCASRSARPGRRAGRRVLVHPRPRRTRFRAACRRHVAGTARRQRRHDDCDARAA